MRKNPCPQGHTCNGATYRLLGNGTYVIPGPWNGIFSINNGGNGNPDCPDYQNLPPIPASPYARYNEIVLTTTQAQALANGAVNGFINFSIQCATPPNVACYQGTNGICHTGAMWVQVIKSDGTYIYNGCPLDDFLNINPCTGEII
jgi:hypothetical protein